MIDTKTCNTCNEVDSLRKSTGLDYVCPTHRGENNRYERTVSLHIHDFYSVINALRESCGCPDCQRIANDLINQGRSQTHDRHRAD
jgi:hypothetical protein